MKNVLFGEISIVCGFIKASANQLDTVKSYVYEL